MFIKEPRKNNLLKVEIEINQMIFMFNIRIFDNEEKINALNFVLQCSKVGN